MRKTARITTPIDTTITQLWMLRMLVPLGGHRAWIQSRGFSDDAIARALHLDRWIDPADGDFDPSAVRAHLRELHRQAERGPAPPLPPILLANLQRLTVLVGLSDVENQILGFATLLHIERDLDNAGDALGTLSTAAAVSVLAAVLDLPERAVRDALAPQGVLARSGLLAVDRSASRFLRSKLDLLSSQFADVIAATDTDPVELLRTMVVASAPPRLSLVDFGHLDQALAILQSYLAHAVSESRPGVNILVHGASGTGKSELARVLAAALGCELLEVASEDGDGDPVSGERRLRAYRAAQCFFDRRQALLLFDEVEDVFGDSFLVLGVRSTAQRRKGWLNRMLEQNRVPTLWLSNAIDCIDPAFVRRFDMVVEVPVPPRAQRERILQAACGDLVDGPTLARMAQAEKMAPAVVDRAASVVRAIRDQLGEPAIQHSLEWLISQTLEAQGYPRLDVGDAVRLPGHYDPALLNADADLAALAKGLTRTRSGRLCLYGPPGTGKSAFGRWLADQLGVPLLLKGASELISKYVGDSEKAIAAAFREAERAGALLMLDEVDSFLRAREGARYSWEVTAVNEMLTRMESFSGLFIASTNLIDDLDPAALRRFDAKIRFDYLQPEQAMLMLERQCAALGLAAPTAETAARARRCHLLTPGDFAALARRHRFTPFTGAADMLQALEQECTLKRGTRSPIGFLA